MKLRVYLDTSVFSAYYDDRLADRQTATKEFWSRLGEFDAATSEVGRQVNISLRLPTIEILAPPEI